MSHAEGQAREMPQPSHASPDGPSEEDVLQLAPHRVPVDHLNADERQHQCNLT